MTRSFFFGGCSWGCAFHIGAYKGMVKKYGYKYLQKCKIGGNSAGALIGVAVALGISWQELEVIYLEIADKAERLGMVGKLSTYHDEALDQIITEEDDYKKLNGRFFVGITTFFKKFHIVSNWESNEELREILHASFHIPFYCTHARDLKKYGKAIDGGFGQGFYKIEPDTIIINPIEKNADVICKPPLSIKDCTFQMSSSKYQQIKLKGYNAMVAWKKPVKNIKPRSSTATLLALMWGLRFLESIRKKHVVLGVTSLFLFKYKQFVLYNILYMGKLLSLW